MIPRYFQTVNFITTILLHNYKSINTIYKNDEDKKRALQSIPITIIYVLLLFTGIGLIFFLFETKGIENNTIPAIQLGGLFLLGALVATIGFFIEDKHIKKWIPDKTASILSCAE